MKKKFNPNLLKEELNRFKLLENYQYYAENQMLPEYTLEEADEPDDAVADDAGADEADDASLDDAIAQAADDLGTDDSGADAGAGVGADAAVDTEADVDAGFGDAPGVEPDMPVEEPAANEEEVDVTALVKGSEEAKQAADRASQNTEMLMQQLRKLEAQVGNMSQITAKIDNLEQEMVKRNPTQVEKMEMRSLSSYPYSQKLTDYWADKEGQYDVMNTQKKPKEYILKQDDVDASYSDANVKKSFNPDNISDSDYTEEDI
jgi:hypothetical protein